MDQSSSIPYQYHNFDSSEPVTSNLLPNELNQNQSLVSIQSNIGEFNLCSQAVDDSLYSSSLYLNENEEKAHYRAVRSEPDISIHQQQQMRFQNNSQDIYQIHQEQGMQCNQNYFPNFDYDQPNSALKLHQDQMQQPAQDLILKSNSGLYQRPHLPRCVGHNQASSEQAIPESNQMMGQLINNDDYEQRTYLVDVRQPNVIYHNPSFLNLELRNQNQNLFLRQQVNFDRQDVDNFQIHQQLYVEPRQSVTQNLEYSPENRSNLYVNGMQHQIICLQNEQEDQIDSQNTVVQPRKQSILSSSNFSPFQILTNDQDSSASTFNLNDSTQNKDNVRFLSDEQPRTVPNAICSNSHSIGQQYSSSNNSSNKRIVQQEYVDMLQEQQPNGYPIPKKPYTQEWLDNISRYIIEHMSEYGICVMDNFLGLVKGNLILEEVHQLFDNCESTKGRLVSNKLDAKFRGTNSNFIRGDRVIWVDGCENGCSEINNLILTLCSIITNCSKLSLYNSGEFDKRVINKRTRAMIACYPGNGSKYVKHVDNPNGDGRCITSIYYLNKNWNSQNDGGLLRMFPLGINEVANIEPLFDRVLFFWSDRRNPHEVQPSNRVRLAITVWFIDSLEISNQANLPTKCTPNSSTRTSNS